MRFSELAGRYSRALYDLSEEAGEQEKTFSQIRDFYELLEKQEDLYAFLINPLFTAEEKEDSLKKALEKSDMLPVAKNFLLLLAKKDRFEMFDEIVEAYQHQADESHGVTRGLVRSASVLGPEERTEVETIVSKVTGKQVILSYTEDSSLIGGLIAQVGSFTFDDSLSSHLTRLKEEINRRAH